MMGSMFILFVIEMYLNAKTGGHSHGGPTGEAIIHHQPNEGQRAAHWPREVQSEEKRPNSANSATTVVVDEPVEEDDDLGKFRLHVEKSWGLDASSKTSGLRESPSSTLASSNTAIVSSFDKEDDKNGTTVTVRYIDEEGQEVDPQVYRKMSTNITLLEGGILFHSIFVGMTISITVDGFVILLIALVFHQAFEGLGLGSRIAAVPYPKGSPRPWLLVLAFGTTAPIGQAIGLAARNSYDPESASGLIVVGVFNAISSGLLIYAALVDLLAEDFLSEEANHLMTPKMKAAAFCWVLAGAAGMSIVGAFA
ncbi:hypothetical protein K4F52_004029 [Lecanicillium sp. MT-2017a]|nr:hypothetical protein K4F52_004029 [Lecanicillium sp. MT-2017a]